MTSPFYVRVCFAAVCSLLLSSAVRAEEARKHETPIHHAQPAHQVHHAEAAPDYGEKFRKAVGINFPGLNARLFFTPKVAGEIRVQHLEHVLVAGGRFYYYPEIEGFKDSRFRAFTGLEADYLSVKGHVSEGNGFAGEIFAGVDYFFHKNFAFQLDFGPAFITVSDHSTAISSDGLHFIFNTGINYYF